MTKFGMSTRDHEGVLQLLQLASTASHPPTPQYPTPCLTKKWRVVRKRAMADARKRSFLLEMPTWSSESESESVSHARAHATGYVGIKATG